MIEPRSFYLACIIHFAKDYAPTTEMFWAMASMLANAHDITLTEKDRKEIIGLLEYSARVTAEKAKEWEEKGL